MTKESSCRDPKRANRLATRVGHVGALVVAQDDEAARRLWAASEELIAQADA